MNYFKNRLYATLVKLLIYVGSSFDTP